MASLLKLKTRPVEEIGVDKEDLKNGDHIYVLRQLSPDGRKYGYSHHGEQRVDLSPCTVNV